MWHNHGMGFTADEDSQDNITQNGFPSQPYASPYVSGQQYYPIYPSQLNPGENVGRYDGFPTPVIVNDPMFLPNGGMTTNLMAQVSSAAKLSFTAQGSAPRSSRLNSFSTLM
jgi:hypothetical protein